MKDRTLEKLATVNPTLRRKVIAILADLKDHGYRLMVTEGKRSRARQLWLYAQGRTRPGRKVTWTTKSKHIDGLACDLAFVDRKGNPSWADSWPWSLIGRSAIAHGLKWGVVKKDGSRTDLGHVELP